MVSSTSSLVNRHSSPSFLSFLKTLSYVVGLSLGFGSIFAAIWSRYLLPLLYSTFSARTAVTEQQLQNMQTVVSSLRTIRSSKMYIPNPPISLVAPSSGPVASNVDPSSPQKAPGGITLPPSQAHDVVQRHAYQQGQAESSTSWTKRSPPSAVLNNNEDPSKAFGAGLSDSLMIEEIMTDRGTPPKSKGGEFQPQSGDQENTKGQWKLISDGRSAHLNPAGTKDASQTTQPATETTLTPSTLSLIPSPLCDLSSQLLTLSRNMSATDTTRTSLLSTINSYTSHLHTQNFLMQRGSSASRRTGGGVHLGSLDANLAKEGGIGKTGGEKTAGGRLEADGMTMLSLTDLDEWDEIKKEIRSIKGLLLSRRGLAIN